MVHDFSLVFDTENPLWKNVLEIFERNESFEKKKTPGRALHHKFPRAFSRMLNESEDNDVDNLISLTYQDHFMIHYYYYRLAKDGGCKQRMALAFKYMVEADGMPKEAITEDNLDIFKEAYNSAVIKACEYYSTFGKGKTISDEQKRIISETMRNRIWSEESKRKISETHKGLKQTPETIEKIRQSNLGQKRSEETKAKLREARKSYVCSEETKKKISESNIGKVMSEEAKEKISKARTGMKFSEEHYKNIGLSKTGFKHSEETKQKLSKMLKGRKEPFTPEHLANVRAAAEKRKGTKLSEETKEKMRQNRKGKKFIIINGKRVREDKFINNVEVNNGT